MEVTPQSVCVGLTYGSFYNSYNSIRPGIWFNAVLCSLHSQGTVGGGWQVSPTKNHKWGTFHPSKIIYSFMQESLSDWHHGNWVSISSTIIYLAAQNIERVEIAVWACTVTHRLSGLSTQVSLEAKTFQYNANWPGTRQLSVSLHFSCSSNYFSFCSQQSSCSVQTGWTKSFLILSRASLTTLALIDNSAWGPLGKNELLPYEPPVLLPLCSMNTTWSHMHQISKISS